jgi:invasion protein IalB
MLSAVLLVPASATLAQEVIKRQHGDWTVQCRESRQQMLCIAFTPLKSPSGAAAGIFGAQPVAGQRLLTLSLDSGFGVGGQVELRVDNNPGSRHGGCENLQCNILLDPADPLQGQLRRGSQLVVRGNNTDYRASLIGYTAAQESFADLQKPRPARR